MNLIVAAMVGLLGAAGIYLMLRKTLFEVLLGTVFLTHSVNLLLIAQGGWRASSLPPIIDESGGASTLNYADPLPQALILTAIVIAFGVTSFLVVLMARGHEEHDSDGYTETGAGEEED